jgi:hypothetical protein
MQHEQDAHGLQTWRLRAQGLELALVQRTPNQTQSFFLARHFPKKIASQIAHSCTFQTTGKNSLTPQSGLHISFDMHDWRVRTRNGIKPVKLKEQWLTQALHTLPKPQQAAFRWSTFPTRQTYAPGDFNWGMTTFDLPPGTSFDLLVTWKTGGQSHQYWIKGLQCPVNIKGE